MTINLETQLSEYLTPIEIPVLNGGLSVQEAIDELERRKKLLTPVESAAKVRYTETIKTLKEGESGLLMRKLHRWALENQRQLRAVDLSFLAKWKTQDSLKVPQFAVFNTGCRGEIELLVQSAGWMSNGDGYAHRFQAQNFNVDNRWYSTRLPLVMEDYLVHAVTFPARPRMWKSKGYSFRFAFNGEIPEKTRTVMKEVKELGVQNLYLVVEAGTWQVDDLNFRYPNLDDPLLLAEVPNSGKQPATYVMVDCFDLTNNEQLIAEQFTTGL